MHLGGGGVPRQGARGVGEGWDASVLLEVARAGVGGGEGLVDRAEAVEVAAQQAGRAVDGLGRVEGVADPEAAGGAGHQLHEALCSGGGDGFGVEARLRSEEHTSELQSLMRIPYAVFCLQKKNTQATKHKLRT